MNETSFLIALLIGYLAGCVWMTIYYEWIKK